MFDHEGLKGYAKVTKKATWLLRALPSLLCNLPVSFDSYVVGLQRKELPKC